MISDRVRQKCVYQTIRQLHEEKGYSLSALYAIADIPRCSYSKWKNRKDRVADQENAAILEEMIRLYSKVKGIYGYRRMTLNIRSRLKKGYNHKRIYRLMKSIHMQSVIRRKKKHYVVTEPRITAENLLNRKFTAQTPNQKWLTDITEFKLCNGKKAYLSAILDLADNSIVSYVLGHSGNNLQPRQK